MTPDDAPPPPIARLRAEALAAARRLLDENVRRACEPPPAGSHAAHARRQLRLAREGGKAAMAVAVLERVGSGE